MSTHTPGPEELGDRCMIAGDFLRAAELYESAGNQAGGHTKAAQMYWRRDRARLAGVAPELLAEFKEFADWVSSNVDNPGAIVMLGYAREVIAKAEGKA